VFPLLIGMAIMKSALVVGVVTALAEIVVALF
jgi:hypothetical protein